VRKAQKKLVLNRDTVRHLGAPVLREAAGGIIVIRTAAGCTTIFQTIACVTNGCPTRVQDCTALC
jgi:hypothetical protein